MPVETMDYMFQLFDFAWIPFSKVLESAFLSAVFGSLAGAYFGARAAQDLAANKQDKDELVKHIKASNYAINLCSSIVEFFANLKQQNITKMVNHQTQLKQTYDAFQAGIRDGSIAKGSELHLELNMGVLSVYEPPVEVLRKQLVERIQVRSARPMRLQIAMEQSAQGLANFIRQRNAWNMEYRERPFPIKELPNKLFGLPYPSGNIDMTYPSCLEAIETHCDDALFLSHLLSLDLQTHARLLRAEYIKRFGQPAPSMQTSTYATLIANKVIPPDGSYKDWFTNFSEEPAYRSRSQRAFDWVKRKLSTPQTAPK